jgi:hypothetical protein
MPHFLHQIAYSREGWQAIVNNPQDRIEAVRPALRNLEARSTLHGSPSVTTTS